MDEVEQLYVSLKDQFLSEEALQMHCVHYWRQMFRPDSDAYYLLYKVHNEGKKTKRQAVKDKSLGILSGAADLNVDIAKHGYHGLRVELKAVSGRQSSNQKRFEQALTKNGYLYRVVRSLDEFKELINWYLGDGESY
jgi:hypothetical protein